MLRAAKPLAVVKGAGDLATGVAYRLHRVGFAVVMTEIAAPTPVRRAVSFAEAVYEGRWFVEGVEAQLVADAEEALAVTAAGKVPNSLARSVLPCSWTRYWLNATWAPESATRALCWRSGRGSRPAETATR
jgi:hypothetical protein